MNIIDFILIVIILAFFILVLPSILKNNKISNQLKNSSAKIGDIIVGEDGTKYKRVTKQEFDSFNGKRVIDKKDTSIKYIDKEDFNFFNSFYE